MTSGYTSGIWGIAFNCGRYKQNKQQISYCNTRLHARWITFPFRKFNFMCNVSSFRLLQESSTGSVVTFAWRSPKGETLQAKFGIFKEKGQVTINLLTSNRYLKGHMLFFSVNVNNYSEQEETNHI